MKNLRPWLARRDFVAVVALAAAGVLGVSAAHTQASGDAVEIRVLADPAFGNTWQTKLVPEFNKQFPNIKVTVDDVPYAEHLAKMMLDATSDAPEYDVLTIDDPWTPQMADIGALVDLRGEVIAAKTGADFDWDDFNAAPLAASEWQGKQYGVPVRSNMLLMFYNRALYKKAGVPEPTEDLTWDQFFENAPKLVQDTNGDGKPDAWAITTYYARDALTPVMWQAIFNAYGGKLLDEAGAPAFNNETGVKTLEMFKRTLDYAPPGAVGNAFTESLQAFRQGQVANVLQWGSIYRAVAIDRTKTTLNEEDVGVQLLPKGSALPGTHRGIWSLGISSKSEKLDAAWTFVQWLSSKQGEATNVTLTGGFPARKSTLSGEPPQPWMKPVFKTLQRAYDVATEGQMWRIRGPHSDAAQQIQADEISRALAGQETAEKALQTMADGVAALK